MYSFVSMWLRLANPGEMIQLSALIASLSFGETFFIVMSIHTFVTLFDWVFLWRASRFLFLLVFTINSRVFACHAFQLYFWHFITCSNVDDYFEGKIWTFLNQSSSCFGSIASNDDSVSSHFICFEPFQLDRHNHSLLQVTSNQWGIAQITHPLAEISGGTCT